MDATANNARRNDIPASVPSHLMHSSVVQAFRPAIRGRPKGLHYTGMILCIAAVLWAALLPLAACIASHAHAAASAANFLAVAVYGIGSVICHQRPERSFFLWGAQLPVCARCIGLYAGAAMAALALLAFRRRPGAVVGHAAMGLLTLAAAPTVATLAFEWLSGVMPGHWVRAVSGVPLGAAVEWVLVSSAAGRYREGVR